MVLKEASSSQIITRGEVRGRYLFAAVVGCVGGGEGGGCGRLWKLTSGTQEAPAHVDGGAEEAVLLGTAVIAADHDVMGEDDAARRQAAVAGVVRQRAADATNQTAWRSGRDAIFYFPQHYVVTTLQQLKRSVIT